MKTFSFFDWLIFFDWLKQLHFTDRNYWQRKTNYGHQILHPDLLFETSTIQSTSEGKNILVNLDANKATDVDGIPARILKSCARELSMPLTKLLKLCVCHSRLCHESVLSFCKYGPSHPSAVKCESNEKKSYSRAGMWCLWSEGAQGWGIWRSVVPRGGKFGASFHQNVKFP